MLEPWQIEEVIREALDEFIGKYKYCLIQVDAQGHVVYKKASDSPREILEAYEKLNTIHQGKMTYFYEVVEKTLKRIAKHRLQKFTSE